jgi:hypothetical protein
MRLDARIPVRIVPLTEWPHAAPVADPLAVLLIAGGILPVPDGNWAAVRQVEAAELAGTDAPHPAGCACCVLRSPLAVLLSTLFEQRARGTLGLFRRVLLVVPPAMAGAAAALLAADPVVAGRFRLGEN